MTKTSLKALARRELSNAGTLANFISPSQRVVLMKLLDGEEGDYFVDKVNALVDTIQSMPKVYGQDGKGEAAIVYLHYFYGGHDWWITERDTAVEQWQAFGRACLHGDMTFSEMGYIPIAELIANNVEFDLYWAPKTMGEVLRERGR